MLWELRGEGVKDILLRILAGVFIAFVHVRTSGLSESEKCAAGKQLCSTVFYLLDGQRHLSLDLIIQCEQLETSDAAVVRSFCK